MKIGFLGLGAKYAKPHKASEAPPQSGKHVCSGEPFSGRESGEVMGAALAWNRKQNRKT